MKKHPLALPPNASELSTVVKTFKALADETRTQIILLLGEGERAVHDLVEILNSPQSTVSRHLANLRAAELVTTRREGTSVFYRLADSHVADLVRQAFAHAQHESLGLPDHDLNTEKQKV